MLFTLKGDVLYPGSVEVEADTLAEAVDKAEDGEFIVADVAGHCLAFIWGGEVEDDEA